jgi:hypothetical protein
MMLALCLITPTIKIIISERGVAHIEIENGDRVRHEVA